MSIECDGCYVVFAYVFTWFLGLFSHAIVFVHSYSTSILHKQIPYNHTIQQQQQQIIPSELPIIGAPNWFLLTLLSPYAGIYYWKSGDRVDDMKVKLATNDDETLNEITIEGNDEEIDRMWRTLDLREKGMVKVEGILG